MSTHPKDMDEFIKTIEECKLFNDLFNKSNIPDVSIEVSKKARNVFADTSSYLKDKEISSLFKDLINDGEMVISKVFKKMIQQSHYLIILMI